MSLEEQAGLDAAIWEGSVIAILLDMHERYPDKLQSAVEAALKPLGYEVVNVNS